MLFLSSLGLTLLPPLNLVAEDGMICIGPSAPTQEVLAGLYFQSKGPLYVVSLYATLYATYFGISYLSEYFSIYSYRNSK